MSEAAAIFDLDDTLVNTAKLLTLREKRRWKECVRQLSKTRVFPGIIDVIDALKGAGIRVGIVTASVSNYAEAVLRHHDIPYDALIAHHDCPYRQKPDPAPVNLCLDRLQCAAKGSLGVGDSAIDARAYAAAGMTAWGAGWSTRIERDAEWSRMVETPDPILSFFDL